MPPKPKSGALRQSVAQFKRHLSEQITRSKTVLEQQLPDTEADCDETILLLQGATDKTQRLIQAVRERDLEWLNLIHNADDDDFVSVEEQHYEQIALGDAGYLTVITDADMLLSDVNTQILRLKNQKQKLAMPTTLAQHQPVSTAGPQPIVAPTTDSGQVTSANGTATLRSSIVKTPKMQLLEFDGNVMKWKQFWSVFEHNIHSQPSLTGVEKFSYLLPLLKEDAKDAIDGLVIDDDNYNVAVDILHQVFDRSGDRLISMLYGELKKMPPCGTRREDKRKTYNACERIFRQLSTAGQDLDSNNSLTMDLLSKFPDNMIRDLQRHYHVNFHSTLSEVRKAVEKNIAELELTSGLIDDLDSMRSKKDDRKSQPAATPGTKPPFPNPNSAFAAFGNRRNGPNNKFNPGRTQPGQSSTSYKRSPCYFCSDSHSIETCPRYPSVFSRRTRLRELDRCFRCCRKFAEGHEKGQCQVSVYCRHCQTNGDHHSAMCLKQYRNQGQGGSVPQGQRPFGGTYNQSTPRPFFHSNMTHTTQARGSTWNGSGNGVPNGQPGSATFPQPPPNQSHNPQRGANTLPQQPKAVQFQDQQNPASTFQYQPASQFQTTQSHPTPTMFVNNSNLDPNVACFNCQDSKRSLFQTAKVWIENPRTRQRNIARICLDTLSNRTYVTSQMARQLQLNVNGSEQLSVSVFGSKKSLVVPTHLVSFGVVESNGFVRHIEANTTELISNSGVLPRQWPAREKAFVDSLKAQGILADDPDDPYTGVDVLIGADYAWEFIQGGKITTDTSIYLIPTTLGMMLAGQLLHDTDRNDYTMLIITESTCQFPAEVGMIATGTKLEQRYPDVDEFWKLETIGISDDPIISDDEVAMDMFKKSVCFENDRYQVEWPWIEEKRILLPSNYELAENRFRSLTTRIKQNPELLAAYLNILQLQIERGIIERVPEQDIATTNLVHYLPHHPVFKPSSNTTKIRIVYDASSKRRNDSVSLNDCLLRGPVILPDLCQCLMRFRTHEIVITSDIEKAFLQVGLKPKERDVTRFLWYKDPTKLTMQDNIAVYRFCRVAFGIISSPFLLAATIRHHLLSEDTLFSKSVVDDVYVDNVISGLDNPGDAPEYYRKIKAIFQRAGMNLAEFCTNSKELMDQLPEGDRVKDPDARVLGIQWDSHNDDSIRITPSSKWKIADQYTTKRHVLRAIASVFDPLGLFQPVLLGAKILLQKLWEENTAWDEKICDDRLNDWIDLQKSISDIFGFRIPRFIGPVQQTSCLVVFSDASDKAYAAAVYLRTYTNDSWTSNLIFAKSRLAPPPNSKKTKISLPRLELMGAKIAAKIGVFCREALKVDIKLHFFIDSQCVLHWIRSDQELKRFVMKRVEEIRTVGNCEFHYVNTKDNPADYSTRGKTAEELLKDKMWWSGPMWLVKEEHQWPKYSMPSVSDKVIADIQNEMRGPKVIFHTMLTDAEPVTPLLGIDMLRFSSLNKLLRVTILCLKFLKRVIWSKLPSPTKNKFHAIGSLFEHVPDESQTRDGHSLSQHLWVKSVQRQTFSSEIEALQQRKKSALIKQLGLQLDDQGIIRSYSRYQHADLSEDAKFPKLLPSKHQFTKLVVDKVHQALLHSGVSHTLNQVRKEFWVPQGRATVKAVLRKCRRCARFKTCKPFPLPTMPSWPKERVRQSFPFKYIGLDYFGPINVSVSGVVRKMWACLFACLSTRAVHLEAVFDCTSHEFLKALIRFVSRRGTPEEIISDNAAQFRLVNILGDRAWKTTPSDSTVVNYVAENGICWKFITELAPWQGGHYERLVGVVKSVMKTAIGRRLLTWTDFVTLLTETEAVVNSRPITHVPSDIDSAFQVIRPVDFLTDLPVVIGHTPSNVNSRDLGDGGKQLVSIWNQRKKYLDRLWKNWQSEYLLSLRERGSAIHRNPRATGKGLPFVGQVVILLDNDIPRGSWKLARITKLFSGSDSQIRSAEIRLSNGQLLKRPINHLVALEVETTSNTDSSHVSEDPRSSSFSDSSNDLFQQNNANSQDQSGFFGFSAEDIERTKRLLDAFRSSSRTG